MDLASILDMLDRTFGDMLAAKATFETAADSVRVDLAVEDRFFCAEIRSSTGDSLRITPGQVIASDGTNSFEALNVDTNPALAALKSQPPTNFSPVAAGLNQLSTAVDGVNQVIGRLAGYGGSLGIGLFPSLCWHTARYPSLKLGDVVLTDFQGRICLDDVNLAVDYVSFSLKLSGTAAQCSITTAMHRDAAQQVIGTDQLVLTNVSFSMSFSADVNLVEETADTVIERANFDADQLTGSFGPPPDAWQITDAGGLRVEIENLRQKLNLSSGTQVSSQGTLRLRLPDCTISKHTQTLGTSTTIDFLAPLQIKGLNAALELDTAAGRPDLTTGEIELDQLQLSVNLADGNLTLRTLNGVLSLDEFYFGPGVVEADFELIDAQLGEADLPTGKTALERLNITGNTVDLSGRFTAASDRTVLLLEKMHLVSQQGTWKLVLDAVNNGSTTDPLALRFASGNDNVIDVFALGFLSVASAIPRTTAERVELRVLNAKTPAAINLMTVSQYHVLTTDSFVALRAIPVPDPVLVKFEAQTVGVQYHTHDALLKEVSDRLTPAEFASFGAMVDNAAVHHFTNVRNVQAEIGQVVFQGSLLEKSLGKSELTGELRFSEAELQWDGIEGLEIPKCSNITQVTPINAGDKYPIKDARIPLPQGSFLPGVAAVTQKLDTVTIEISGANLNATSTQNHVRVNLLPQLPTLDGIAGQVTISSATLSKGSLTLTLDNAFVDVYQKKFTPSLGSEMAALKTDTTLKFGIMAEPIVIPIIPAHEEQISLKDGGLDFLKKLLAAAGVSVGSALDVIEKVLNNPAAELVEGILSTLGDILGFGIDDFGIQVRTPAVTAQVEGAPLSTANRIAVSVAFTFPDVGPWVTFHYRVPAFDIPPWEDKQSGPHGFFISPFPIGIKALLTFGYRVNAVEHRIDITDVNVQILPTTGTPVDLVIGEAEKLFDAIVPVSIIRQRIVDEISQQLKLAFPDDLNLDLARIDFDTSGKMTISVEGRELQWNSF